MKHSPEDLAGGAVSLVFLATAAVIVLTVASQIISWLKSGIWQPYSISMMLNNMGTPRPVVSWLGIQKIVDEVLGWHAAIAMAAIGILVAIVVFSVIYGLLCALKRIFSPLPPKRP